jgi:hypothetical protein
MQSENPIRKLRQPNRYSCFPACVASILNMSTIPDEWLLEAPTEREFNRSERIIKEFLKKNNIFLTFFGPESYDLMPGANVILIYNVSENSPHAVVAQYNDNETFSVLHDPNEDLMKTTSAIIERVDVKSFAIVYSPVATSSRRIRNYSVTYSTKKAAA